MSCIPWEDSNELLSLLGQIVTVLLGCRVLVEMSQVWGQGLSPVCFVVCTFRRGLFWPSCRRSSRAPPRVAAPAAASASSGTKTRRGEKSLATGGPALCKVPSGKQSNRWLVCIRNVRRFSVLT